MKSQPVEFLEWVEHDLHYAREFYASWLTNGADLFLDRFRETISWIEWNPEQFIAFFAGPSSDELISASTSPSNPALRP